MKIETRNLIFWIIVLTSVSITLTAVYLSYKDTEETIKKIEAASIIQSELLKDIQGEELDGGGEMKRFAKCLTEAGVKFYGTYWCGWCDHQKELFGEAAKNIPYIECSEKETGKITFECQEAGITGFPTWQFSDGTRSSGYKSLEKLAELSGC